MRDVAIMLQNEQNNSETIPAAQVRVRSEDLARAISIIEARRQREAQEREGTLIIGETIDELRLDITPEELLAEVQALHIKEVQEDINLQYETVYHTPSRRMPPWILGGGVIAIVVILICWSIAATQTHPVPPLVYNSPPVTTPVYPPMYATAFTGMPHNTVYSVVTSQLISEIPNDSPFGCNSYTLDQNSQRRTREKCLRL